MSSINKNKINALVYCRVSSKKQESEGSGLTSQEGRCMSFLKEKGYMYEKSFFDTFSGGGDFLKRPAMSEMINYLVDNSHKKYVVIFDDTKRFARDVLQHWRLRAYFKDIGVEIDSPNFDFKEDSEESWLHETITATFNDYDRRTNRRQVVQKQKARLERGYWAFRAPIGYKMVRNLDHGKLGCISEDGESIKTALEKFASGEFQTKIEVAKYLKDKNVFGKAKPEKYITTVSHILSDVYYVGDVEFKKWDVERRKGFHEPLISIETFDLIQRRLKSKNSKVRIRKDINEDFPVRGCVDCTKCKKSLRGYWAGGNGGRYRYYECKTKGCLNYGKTIKADQVESRLSEIIGNSKPISEVVDLAYEVFNKVWNEELKERNNFLTRKKEQKEKIEADIDSLTNKVLRTDNEVLIRQYEKQIEKKSLEIDEINNEFSDAVDYNVSYRTASEKVFSLLKNPHEIWESSNVYEKHKLFNLIFEDNLEYDKEEGYRTAKLSLPLRLFQEISPLEPVNVEMAGIEPACK